MRHEGADIAAEADGLSRLIERHIDALRAARVGTTSRLDAFAFRLHARGRNTIYRVSGRFDWFLKLPRDGSCAPMRHERLGADVIQQALGNDPGYYRAAATRVSIAPPYVLTTVIPGKGLNRIVFTGAWLPRASKRLDHDFRALGSLLATLHSGAVVVPDAPRATTRPFHTLAGLIDRAAPSDDVSEAIAIWHESHRRDDSGDTFVHGNFRLDNVLRVGSQFGIIDLENCGIGSTYQDLSRPVAELLLTRSMFVFPGRRAARYMAAFLLAYGRVRPFDRATLADYVAARVARYYLEARARNFRVTIGSVPIARKKLQSLTRSVLQNDIGSMLPTGAT